MDGVVVVVVFVVGVGGWGSGGVRRLKGKMALAG